MNVAEFKAWFEGYIDAMDEPPSQYQFNKIKEKVRELKPDSMHDQDVYVDRAGRSVQPKSDIDATNVAEREMVCPVGTPAGIPSWSDTWPDGSPRLIIP